MFNIAGELNATQISTLLAQTGYNPFINYKKGAGKRLAKITENYIFYFGIFAQLAQIAYLWENLPIEIPPYQMEKNLFYYGISTLFKDDTIEQYVCLPAKQEATLGLDIYGNPVKYTVWSPYRTYEQIIEDRKNGAVCYNNVLKNSSAYLAYRYAKRLQLVDEIIDLNFNQQRTPYLLGTNDYNITTVENLIQKLENGEMKIKWDMGENIEDVLKVVDLKVEFKALDLIQAKKEIFNEACMFLGISSDISQKKERLTEVEAEAQQNKFDIYREFALLTRNHFCKKVNKLYGIDLKVDFVLDSKKIKEAEETIMKARELRKQNIKDEIEKEVGE